MQLAPLRYYLLMMLALCYAAMLGGGFYEQLNITHKVASAPPQSLAMLQGEYGFNPVRFWVMMRPATLLLFVISIVSHWKTPLRKNLLAAFGFDVLVIVATFGYFAPETGVIMSSPFSETVDPELLRVMQRWEKLNWLRMGAMAVVSLLLVHALGKGAVISQPSSRA